VLGRGKPPVKATSAEESSRSSMAPRSLPSNRRIRPSEDEPATEVPAGSGKVKGRQAKEGRPGRLRALGAAFRDRLQGVRAAASIVFVVAASIALAWGIKQHVVTSPRFAVKTIRVEGTARRTPEQMSTTAGLSIGMNIFSADLEAARRRLLQDPWVATAEVERKLPSTLTLTLTEREAAAVVSVDADLYLCTPEGEMFKKLEADDPIGLVVISGLTASLVSSDRKLAVSRVRTALELMGHYALRGPAQQHPIQEIGIADDGSLRMVVGRSAVTLEMGRAPYRTKVLRAARILREVQKQKAEPAVVFLDNEAHPERVVVRMR